jgi:hypothetical protein
MGFMMKSIDLANSPVINDGQAVFEVVGERDGGGLPAVLKLTLGSRLRQSLESEDNMVIPGKRPDLGLVKIELDGRKVIDCAANAQFLHVLAWKDLYREDFTLAAKFTRGSLYDDLARGDLTSAAKFILDWGESDGILIKDKDALWDVLNAVSHLCGCVESICGKVFDDQQEMQMMFRELVEDFNSFIDNQKMFRRDEK